MRVVALQALRAFEEDPRGGRLGLILQQLAAVLAGFVVAAQIAQRERDADPRLDQIGVELDRLAGKRSSASVRCAAVAQHVAEIAMRGGRCGLEREHVLEALPRFVVAAEAARARCRGCAATSVDFGSSFCARSSTSSARCQLADAGKRNAEVAQGFGVIGPQFDRGLERPHGAARIAEVEQRRAEARVRR